MGFIHSNYASITRKGILIMPYLSLTTRKNSKESLTTIFCTVTIYLYISFKQKIMDVTVTWSQTSSDSHKREMVFLCTELHRTPKSHIHNNECNITISSHTYTTMNVTKTNITISITQPNDISVDCQVFRLPFRMAWQYYGS